MTLSGPNYWYLKIFCNMFTTLLAFIKWFFYSQSEFSILYKVMFIYLLLDNIKLQRFSFSLREYDGKKKVKGHSSNSVQAAKGTVRSPWYCGLIPRLKSNIINWLHLYLNYIFLLTMERMSTDKTVRDFQLENGLTQSKTDKQ